MVSRSVSMIALMAIGCTYDFDNAGPLCDGEPCPLGGASSTGGSPPVGGSSAGGGGAASTGGSSVGGMAGAGGVINVGGNGGAGGQGGGTNPVVCIIAWSVPDHSAGKYLGIGGIVGGPYVKPLPGCMAPTAADESVSCVVGELASGPIQLNLYNYNDAAGTSPFASRCDQPGFPTSDCPGTVTIECDGQQVVSSFQDDNNSTTPPPAPWGYVDVGGFLELTATIP